MLSSSCGNLTLSNLFDAKDCWQPQNPQNENCNLIKFCLNLILHNMLVTLFILEHDHSNQSRTMIFNRWRKFLGLFLVTNVRKKIHLESRKTFWGGKYTIIFNSEEKSRITETSDILKISPEINLDSNTNQNLKNHSVGENSATSLVQQKKFIVISSKTILFLGLKHN